MTALRIDGLTIRFRHDGREQAVVQDAALQVHEGETFGLLGPSGCGKSTLLRAVAGLHREWSGAIRVFGTALTPGQRIGDPLRAAIQMVFQDPYGSLHPMHRVGRIIGEPLRIRHRDAPEAEVAAVLRQVGLAPDIATRLPHQLSGGQRQRVAIARTLVLRPRLLLLDEPTSALDLSVQAEILNLLNDLKAAHGMTLVLVSHDPAVVAHMCDRAARMDRGRIVAALDRPAIAHEDECMAASTAASAER